MNLIYLVPPLLAAGIAAVLLGVLSVRRTRGAAHDTFALLLACIIIWALLIFALRTSPDVDHALFWDRMVPPLAFLASLLAYRFSLALTRQEHKKRLLVAAYLGLAVFVLMSPFNLIITRIEVQPYGYAPIMGPGILPLLAFSYILLTLTVYNLLWAYRRSKDYEERNRYLYISIAMIFPLVGGIFEVLPTIYPTAIFGLTAFCAITSVAVFRYHLFDVNVVIRKSVAYAITSVIIGGMYGAVIFLFGRALASREVRSWLVELPLLVALSFLLQPIWRWVQDLVDKRFYRSHYDRLQALEELAGLTAAIVDLGELASSLLQRVSRALGTSKACLLLPSAESDDFAQVSAQGVPAGQAAVSIETRSPLIPWLTRYDGILSEKDLDVVPELQGVWGKDRSTLRGWEFIVPLKSRGNLTGILMLGRKLSERLYTREDFRMLQVVSNQLAMNLENAQLYAVERARVAHLEKLEDARSGLLLTVAHELKTPITAIKTAASLLVEEEGEHRARNRARLIQSIMRGADALDRLSTESLDLAKLKTATMEFNPTLRDIHPLIEEATSVIAPALKANGQTLKVEVPTTLPPAVVDGDRFKQILLNLLSNAHKYTPRGGQITLCATRNRSDLMFEVSDNGMGIPPPEQALVFQPFHRVRSKSGTETPGSGLGLAIVKSLVELHKGRIWLRSRENVGSSFFFTIPLEPSGR